MPEDTPEKISPVLLRLIEEVRQEKAEGPQAFNAYNRMHNRHNRSLHPLRRPLPSPKPEDKP